MHTFGHMLLVSSLTLTPGTPTAAQQATALTADAAFPESFSTVRGLIEMPDGSRLVAPDLGRAARNYSIAELDGLIRHGVRPNGTSMTLVMPSNMFYHLSDEDFGAILAFLRSQEPGDEQLPDSRIGPVMRLMLFYYKQMMGTILDAQMIDHDMPRIASTDRGHYLAQTVCTECHGNDLRGLPAAGAPDLAVALAYPIEDFRKLMRTGEPTGERQLGVMAGVAVSRFVHFTDEEIDALHTYLQTFATTPMDR